MANKYIEHEDHYALRKIKKVGLVSALISASALSFLATTTKPVHADSLDTNPKETSNNDALKEEAEQDIQNTSKSTNTSNQEQSIKSNGEVESGTTTETTETTKDPDTKVDELNPQEEKTPIQSKSNEDAQVLKKQDQANINQQDKAKESDTTQEPEQSPDKKELQSTKDTHDNIDQNKQDQTNAKEYTQDLDQVKQKQANKQSDQDLETVEKKKTGEDQNSQIAKQNVKGIEQPTKNLDPSAQLDQDTPKIDQDTSLDRNTITTQNQTKKNDTNQNQKQAKFSEDVATLKFKPQEMQLPPTPKKASKLVFGTSLYSLGGLLGDDDWWKDQFLPEPKDAQDLNSNEYVYDIQSDPDNTRLTFTWRIKDLYETIQSNTNQLVIESRYDQMPYSKDEHGITSLNRNEIIDAQGDYIGYAVSGRISGDDHQGTILTLDPSALRRLAPYTQDLDIPVTINYRPHYVKYDLGTSGQGTDYLTTPVNTTITFRTNNRYDNTITAHGKLGYIADGVETYSGSSISSIDYTPITNIQNKAFLIVGGRHWNYSHTNATDALYQNSYNTITYNLNPAQLGTKHHYELTVGWNGSAEGITIDKDGNITYTDNNQGNAADYVAYIKNKISHELINPNNAGQHLYDPIDVNGKTYYQTIKQDGLNMPEDKIHISNEQLNGSVLSFDMYVDDLYNYKVYTTIVDNPTDALFSGRINDNWQPSSEDEKGVILYFPFSDQVTEVTGSLIPGKEPNYNTDIKNAHDVPYIGNKVSKREDYLYGDSPDFVPYSAYGKPSAAIQKYIDANTFKIDGQNKTQEALFYLTSDQPPFDAKLSNSPGRGRLVFVDSNTKKPVYSINFSGRVQTQPGTIDVDAAKKWLSDNHYVLNEGQSIPSSIAIIKRNMDDIDVYVHMNLKQTPITASRTYKIYDDGILKNTITINYDGYQYENLDTHQITYSEWVPNRPSTGSYDLERPEAVNLHTHFTIRDNSGKELASGQDTDLKNVNNDIFDITFDANSFHVKSHTWQNDMSVPHDKLPDDENIYITHTSDTEKRQLTIHYLDQTQNNKEVLTQTIDVPYEQQYNDYELNGFVNLQSYLSSHLASNYLINESTNDFLKQSTSFHGFIADNGHIRSFGWRDMRHELGHQNTDLYVHVARATQGTVDFVDTEENNKVVETHNIQGLVNDKIDLSYLTVPTNYILAEGQAMPISYKLHDNDNHVIIRLAHKHQEITDPKKLNADAVISFTLYSTMGHDDYNSNVGDNLQSDHLRDIKFTRTGYKDLVTGQEIYSNWSDATVVNDMDDLTGFYQTKDGQYQSIAKDEPSYPYFKDATTDIEYLGNGKFTISLDHLPEEVPINNDQTSPVVYYIYTSADNFGDNTATSLNQQYLSKLPKLSFSMPLNFKWYTDTDNDSLSGFTGFYNITVQAGPKNLSRNINFIDEDTGQILKSQLIYGERGQIIQNGTEVPHIPGYILDQDKAQAIIMPDILQYNNNNPIISNYNLQISNGKVYPLITHFIEENTDINIPMKKETIKVPHNNPVEDGTPISGYDTNYIGDDTFPQGLSKNDLNSESTRTIIIEDDSNPGKSSTVTQTVHWVRDAVYTPATGEIKYTDWYSIDDNHGIWPEFKLDQSRNPQVTGVEVDNGGNIPAVITNHDTDDTTVYVHYPYINENVPIIWEDADMSNREIKRLTVKASDLDPYESLLDWVTKLNSNTTLDNFDYWHTANGYKDMFKKYSFKVTDSDGNVVIPEVTRPDTIAGKTIGTLFNGGNPHGYIIIITKTHGERHMSDSEAHVQDPVAKTKDTIRTIRVHMPDGTIKTRETGIVWGLIDSNHDSVTGIDQGINGENHYKPIKNKHNDATNPAYPEIDDDYIHKYFGSMDGYNLDYEGDTDYEPITSDSDSETVDVYARGKRASIRIEMVTLNPDGNIGTVHTYNYLVGHVGSTYELNYPGVPAGYQPVFVSNPIKQRLSDQGYTVLNDNYYPEYYKFTTDKANSLVIVVQKTAGSTGKLQIINNYDHPIPSNVKGDNGIGYLMDKLSSRA